jgi:hypothetical protein
MFSSFLPRDFKNLTTEYAEEREIINQILKIKMTYQNAE